MGARLKEQLQAETNHKSVLSLFVGFPSMPIVEMAAYHGFDAVVLDNEHGTFTEEKLEYMAAGVELAGATPLVRVPSAEPSVILKAMDRGVYGVHVPQVETRKLAEQVVEAVKYPPRGKRGAAFSMRAAHYGTIPMAPYLVEANRVSLVCIHIESIKAVENLAEIAKVSDVDMWYIGPTDLSVSLGLGGTTTAPIFTETMEEIKRQAVAAGVRLGIHAKSGEEARQRADWGADYVGITVTSLVNQSFFNYLKQSRREERI